MDRLKLALLIVCLGLMTLVISACGGLQPGPDMAQKYHEQGLLALNATGDGHDPEKAVEYFSQAIQSEPNFAKSYNARGVAYVLLGEYDKARADFEKTLEIDPTNVQAQENLKHLAAGEYDLVTEIQF
jgi:tetratricopeptide (TPR) repeat protein